MPLTCSWDRAWIGPCGAAVLGNSPFCPEHEAETCCSRQAHAVRDCEHTGIQFVCGAPLCANCEHGTPDPENPGLFWLGGGHRPKSGGSDG